MVLKGLVRLASLLPLRARRAVGTVCGQLASFVPTRDRRVAYLQVEHFLGLKNPSAIVRSMYAGLGCSVLESLDFKSLLQIRPKIIDCPNRALLDRLRASGRPLIALSGHVSNWELLAAWAVSEGFPLVTIGRLAHKAGLQSILEELRARHGVKTLWRGNHANTLSIVRQLRGGTIVAALIDQDLQLEGEFVPFLGVAANTSTGILALGKSAGADFFSAFLTRNKAGYTVHIEAIDANLSNTDILRVYHRHLEKVIRAFPDQWVWFHKRWRTRPDDGRLSSSQYLEWLVDLVPRDPPL